MADKVLVKGNEALGEAAIKAGCRFFFGYPITPQTELSEYLAKRFPKVGGTFLQAESEVAAINMVLGAASAGARVMTSSSSPGISLKSEGISYIAGSDLPAVIVNIQRGGPGLGGIQPSQADYFQATKGGGHGDYRLIVLAPNSVQEIVSLTFDAFDLADLYRMPVMILGDGMLGQMMEPVEFPEHSDRVLPEKTWATDTTQGKRKKNIVNSLYIKPDVLEKIVLDRYERYAEVEAKEARAENYLTEDADIIITAYGATSRISRNAVDALRASGIKAGLLRPITLWPFPKAEYQRLAKTAKAFLTVEMSMGQMIEDVKLYTQCKKPVALCNRCGGMIPSPDEVLESIRKAQKGEF